MAKSQNMVLRTVYISPELDDLLQRKSFIENISKNDLIRRYIVEGMRAEAACAQNHNDINIIAK